MRNTTKLALALVAMLTIGATAVFAAGDTNWDGTGTGICWSNDSTEYFTPFKVWSGSSSGSTFSGTWTDSNNNEEGTFSGNWIEDPSQPPNQYPRRHVSNGTWKRKVSQGGGTAYVEWGDYSITFDGFWSCAAIYCSGDWDVTYTGWSESGSGITGSYYYCPD